MTNHTQLSKRFFMAKLPRRSELAKMRKPVKMTTPIQLSKPFRIAKLPWRAELAKMPEAYSENDYSTQVPKPLDDQRP